MWLFPSSDLHGREERLMAVGVARHDDGCGCGCDGSGLAGWLQKGSGGVKIDSGGRFFGFFCGCWFCSLLLASPLGRPRRHTHRADSGDRQTGEIDHTQADTRN